MIEAICEEVTELLVENVAEGPTRLVMEAKMIQEAAVAASEFPVAPSPFLGQQLLLPVQHSSKLPPKHPLGNHNLKQYCMAHCCLMFYCLNL
jgi:hypothetical protein